MACCCGSSGCGSNQAKVDMPLEAAGVQALAPRVEVRAEVIVSSEQEWPRIKVNGQPIATEAIAHELQYHPAASREEAVFLASQALVIRALLQQRATELGLQPQPGGENEEEALTRALLEHDVPTPRADAAACQHYYDANRSCFASAPLLAVRHILLACPADDAAERSLARERAQALIAQLQANDAEFSELAVTQSHCPSKLQGGALGQISQGQTVPEFERQLFRLPLGLASQPLESRYGFHVVQVDQRIEGQQLPFELVEGSIRAELEQRVWQVAVAQYLKLLVGNAYIQGIVLKGADSPPAQ